jgi:glutathione peroxidase-family protein
MGPLADLDKKYKDKRFRVVGFLSDDFGHQGGTTEEVTSCSLHYGASFDEFAHIHVKKGPEQHPLFAWLTSRPTVALLLASPTLSRWRTAILVLAATAISGKSGMVGPAPGQLLPL